MWFKGYCAVKWFWTGWNNYTGQGFEKNSTNFSSLETIHTTSLEIIVTGASSGIGNLLWLELISHQHCSQYNNNLTPIYLRIGYAAVNKLSQFPFLRIHMICSNENRGKESFRKLKSNVHSSSEIFLHIVDLTDIKSVKRFAQDFVSRNISINVLINNAGILPIKYETIKNSDIEYSFALNVLGVKVLTEGLLPVLKPSLHLSSARVITVTSGGALTECLNYNDPALIYSVKETIRNFDGVAMYAKQKRQQIHLTEYWAEKYPSVHFMTMHPGWVDTPGVQKSIPAFYKYMKPRLRTPEQGADTIVYLTLDPDVDKNNREGLLYFDRLPVDKVVSPHQIPTKEQIKIFIDNLNELQERF